MTDDKHPWPKSWLEKMPGGDMLRVTLWTTGKHDNWLHLRMETVSPRTLAPREVILEAKVPRQVRGATITDVKKYIEKETPEYGTHLDAM